MGRVVQTTIAIVVLAAIVLWANCVGEAYAQKKALPEGVGAQGSITWAGARLVKADMDLQQKLDEKLEDGDSAPPDAPTLQDIIRSGETAEGDR